jgi:hypothetical protein
MKDITKEEIEELLTIIPRSYPSLDLYIITHECDKLTHQIDKLCKSEGYLFDIMLTNYENCKDLKVHKFDFDKNRYNRHSRLYDFVFVNISLDDIEDISTFYKKLYAISKNGGKVLFFTDKYRDLQELEERLIEKNYVAINPIINTFKNYQILSAQKMHGWGD